MKWCAFNTVGGLAWIGGLFIAKATYVPGGNLLFTSDHNLLGGLLLGASGLALLVWTNLRVTG